MATLTVLYNMAELHKLPLQREREYVAGRQDSCDVVLKEHAGISRQHFKLSYDGTMWVVSLISKYGDLIYNGEAVQQIDLSKPSQFSVGPYTFIFDPDISSTAIGVDEEDQKIRTNLPAIGGTSPMANRTDYRPTAPHPQVGFDEITSPGGMQTVPYLRIKNLINNKEDILRLEGNLWIGGRDAQCEIHIDDNSASRRHFEIGQEGDHYFIADLESSNGTILNGDTLVPHHATPLMSGDKIEIRDIQIIFELRDPNFQEKLASVPQALMISSQPQPPFSQTGMHYPAMKMPGDGILRVPPVADHGSSEIGGLLKSKQGVFRLTLVVFAVVLVLYSILNDDKTGQNKTNPTSTRSTSYDKLSPEQKVLVKQSYQLARSLYMQRKYELARAQLQKLHQIIDVYEESREIEKLVEQAFLLIQQKEEMDKTIEEQKRVASEIQSILAHCQVQLKNSSSTGEAEDCLLPATVKDPNHPGIRTLMEQVATREQAELQRKQDQQHHQQLASEARSIYSRALSLQKSGKTKEALSVFRSLASSSLPNTDNLKDKAKEQIDAITAETERVFKQKMKSANDSYSRQDDRSTILAAEEALKIIPDNSTAIALKGQARKRLNKSLKVIYEDSIIEEGFGEIEPAKEKWKKIKDLDTVGGDYYLKASQKLQKYGG